jgi:hypothetical protein
VEPAEWAWLKETWEQFTTAGATIELRPLQTRDERTKYIDEGWKPGDRLERAFPRVTPFSREYFSKYLKIGSATFRKPSTKNDVAWACRHGVLAPVARPDSQSPQSRSDRRDGGRE